MNKHTRHFAVALFGTALLCGSLQAGTPYIQTTLASDVQGKTPDSDLKNPWGMAFSSNGVFWISDQMTGKATLYNGAGAKQGLVVTIPGGSPTGIVSNFTSSFLLKNGNGNKAAFTFASLSGNILGWNGGTTALIEQTVAGASFTGLALASNGGSDFLYAADFANARIDVFDGSFAPTTVPGGFVDQNLPVGYSPYNIQVVAGKLFVEYTKADSITHRPTTTPNTGIVNIFDLSGTLLQRLATETHLNSPWGVTQAPAGFGSFAGDILVGNHGDGTISAFNPVSRTFDGLVADLSGKAITNGGLWALNFRAPGSGFDPNTLFLTAGINGAADGLFAKIQVERCPIGEDDWKNNPNSWPIFATMVLGSQSYTKAELVQIMQTAVSTDGSENMAVQLIATNLNILNGSDPEPIGPTITLANALLSDFSGKLPYNVQPFGNRTGDAMMQEAFTFDLYNHSHSTPQCAP